MIDQSDMLAQTVFESVQHEVGNSKALLFSHKKSIVVEDILNMCDGIPLLVDHAF